MTGFLFRLFFLAVIPALFGTKAYSADSMVVPGSGKIPQINLENYLKDFYPLVNDAVYSITICADLPVNDDPACVYRKGEPGHVFLILKKQASTGEVIARSFGFYPRVPVSCLIKRVRSRIMENANREYEASLTSVLTAEEFHLIIQKCKEGAKRKYDLKRYNCYDYVLTVFNSLPGTEKIPVSYVKFPFIFGRGGSPCSLYAGLRKLISSQSSLSACISFGSFKSPLSDRTSQSIVSCQ